MKVVRIEDHFDEATIAQPPMPFRTVLRNNPKVEKNDHDPESGNYPEHLPDEKNYREDKDLA